MPADKPTRWTPEQDRRLREAVQRFGDKDQWQQVATLVPGRDNKACRKRWLHSLVPTVKKTAWSKEEDDKLVALVSQHGDKWAVIARAIPGRTDDACSKRYREALNPSLRKTDWTEEEDQTLRDLYRDKGSNWKEIGEALLRGSLACRNRWHLLGRKKSSKLEIQEPSSQSDDPLCSASSSSTLPPQTSPELPGESVKVLYFSPDGTETSVYIPCETFHASPHDLSISTPLNQHYEGPPAHQAETSFSSLKAAVGLPIQTHNTLTYNSPQIGIAHPESYGWDMSSTPFEQSQEQFAMATNDAAVASTLEKLEQELAQMGVPALPGLLEFPLSSGPSGSSSSLSNFAFLPMDSPVTQNRPQRSSVGEFDFSNEVRNWEMDTHTTQFSYDFPVLAEPPPPIDAEYYMGFPSAVNTPAATTPATLNGDFTSSEFASPAYASFPRLDPDPYEQATSSASPSPLESVHSLPQSQTAPSSPENDNGLWTIAPESPPPQSLLFSGRTKPRRPRIPGTSELQFPVVVEQEEEIQSPDDHSMRPYACGHPNCWSSTPDTSICYTTAKGLLSHYRANHEDAEDDEDLDKPFKCGLPGCKKAWKNINGLQYHLQVSTFHFRDMPATSEGGSKNDGKFKCTVANCTKTYKNPGGLKYHLKHGHPKKLPVQVIDLCGGSPPMNWPRRSRKELPSAGKSQAEP